MDKLAIVGCGAALFMQPRYMKFIIWEVIEIELHSNSLKR
jgi:hypothetical protein